MRNVPGKVGCGGFVYHGRELRPSTLTKRSSLPWGATDRFNDWEGGRGMIKFILQKGHSG